MATSVSLDNGGTGSLRLLGGPGGFLGPDAQRTGAAAHFIPGACARHAALVFGQFGCGEDGGVGGAAETLTRVLGAGDGVSFLVAEGDAGVVGHLWAVEVGPLWERARGHGVCEAA